MLAEIQMKDREREMLEALTRDYVGAGKQITRLPGPGEPRDALPPPAPSGIVIPSDGQTSHLHRRRAPRRVANHQDRATAASWQQRQALVAANEAAIRRGVAEGLTPAQIGKQLSLSASIVRSISAELSLAVHQAQKMPPPPPPTKIDPPQSSHSMGGRLMALAALGVRADKARRDLGLTRYQFENLVASCNIKFKTRNSA